MPRPARLAVRNTVAVDPAVAVGIRNSAGVVGHTERLGDGIGGKRAVQHVSYAAIPSNSWPVGLLTVWADSVIDLGQQNPAVDLVAVDSAVAAAVVGIVDGASGLASADLDSGDLVGKLPGARDHSAVLIGPGAVLRSSPS